MPEVTYTGPTSRADITTEYHVDDENGKRHVLRKGVPTDVPAALAKTLLDGPKGHRFEKAEASNANGNTTGPPKRS